jgi:hypothetical protein
MAVAMAAGAPATLTLGGKTIQVEVADDPSSRAIGLMGRAALPVDSGMLFVYPDEAERSFWMKNTPLPLSIAFIAKSGRIVHITDMQPLDESPVASKFPVMYALEMKKGWFESHSVRAGQIVAGLPGASRR